MYPETQAESILLDAQKFMERALQDLASARDASGMDIWGVGGSFADMAERSSLSSAQNHASQVEMLVSQAKRTQPKVGNIGPMKIAGGHVMSDIIFDNIFSDMAMHDEIKQSQFQVQNAAKKLDAEVQAARQREGGIKTELEGAARRLEEARKKLEGVRRETFNKVAGGLPAYSEVSS